MVYEIRSVRVETAASRKKQPANLPTRHVCRSRRELAKVFEPSNRAALH